MSTKMVAVMSHATSAALMRDQSQVNEGSPAKRPAMAMRVIAVIRITHFLCTFIFLP